MLRRFVLLFIVCLFINSSVTNNGASTDGKKFTFDDIANNLDLIDELEVSQLEIHRTWYIIPIVSMPIAMFPLTSGDSVGNILKTLFVDKNINDRYKRFVLNPIENLSFTLLKIRQVRHCSFGFGGRVGWGTFSKSIVSGSSDDVVTTDLEIPFYYAMGVGSVSWYKNKIDILSSLFVSLNFGGGIIIRSNNLIQKALPWNKLKGRIKASNSVVTYMVDVTDNWPVCYFFELAVGYNKIGGFLSVHTPLFYSLGDMKFCDKEFQNPCYIPIEVGVYVELG